MSTFRDVLLSKFAEMPDSTHKIDTIVAALKRDIEDNQGNPDVVLALAQRYADWKEMSHIVRVLQPDLTSCGLTLEETGYVTAGKRINAIKLVRERLGIGLKEAKDLVDNAADIIGIPKNSQTL